MSRNLRFLLSIPVLTVTSFQSFALAAKQIATAVRPEAEETANRGDIVVTGLRADEGQNQIVANGALGAKTLFDTPFSITVVDQDIAKRQATTTASTRPARSRSQQT